MTANLRETICTVVFATLLFALLPAQAQTADPQQTLNQYVADLQSNPNDTALRGKIIALAQSMSPPPETPAEARRHMARGVAAVEDAKTPADFKDACNEFQQAATLAPWLANAYRNLAIAQDKAGLYDESLGSLRLYLLTRPSPTDADWAGDLKAKVEYRKEKAAKAKEEENSPQAVAAREQQSFEDLLRKIDGRRYFSETEAKQSGELYNRCPKQALDIEGHFLVYKSIGRPICSSTSQNYSVSREAWRSEIRGRVVSYSQKVESDNGPDIAITIQCIISDDGSTITFQSAWNGISNKFEIFRWQR